MKVPHFFFVEVLVLLGAGLAVVTGLGATGCLATGSG
jgi:hypothetical protein